MVEEKRGRRKGEQAVLGHRIGHMLLEPLGIQAQGRTQIQDVRILRLQEKEEVIQKRRGKKKKRRGRENGEVMEEGRK